HVHLPPRNRTGDGAEEMGEPGNVLHLDSASGRRKAGGREPVTRELTELLALQALAESVLRAAPLHETLDFARHAILVLLMANEAEIVVGPDGDEAEDSESVIAVPFTAGDEVLATCRIKTSSWGPASDQDLQMVRRIG